jgi:hypothetical protein
VTAVQDDEHVSAADGDLAYESAQLNVCEVVPMLCTAIVQHERLVESVWLEYPVLRRCFLL